MCQKYPGMRDVTELHSTKVYDVHGFVGYDQDFDIIVMSFAGTDPFSIADWYVMTRKGLGWDGSWVRCQPPFHERLTSIPSLSSA